MEMPKFHEIMYPLLDFIKEGQEFNVREISDSIRDKYFGLTDKQKKEKVANGYTRFHDRLMWARTYLSKAGLVRYPNRGFVQITDRGLEMLEEKVDSKSITKKDLSRFKEYLDFKNSTRDKDTEGIEEDFSADTPQEKIDLGFNEIGEALKDELLRRLKETNPYYFEKIVLMLFQKMGYGDFEETPKSGDGGIDGVISQDKLGLEKIYTQAKRYTSTKVSEKDMRDFIGAMSGDVNKGIFVTTSSFDASAVKKAQSDHNHKIVLIDGNKLIDLMILYEVGVQTETEYKIKEIDEDFFVG